MAGSLPVIWIGYSLLFGGANGLGYGFGLQIAAQANKGQEGKAMGIVTAAYALGATLAPALFSYAVTSGGFQLAMLGLGAAVLLASIASAALLKIAKFKFQVNQDSRTAPSLPPDGFALLWVAYGAGVSGGLMIIGHAAGIASAQRLEAASWIAPAVIAASNLAGSLIAGRLMDRFSAQWLLSTFPLLSAMSVGALALTPSPAVMLAGFAGVGFTYGGIIAAYPATIAKVFGAKNSSQIYGRVFTAWGLAGLVAPWLAGKFFAVTGNYSTALWVAAALAALSSATALGFLSSARLKNRLEA
jgi:MFS family permease